MNHQQLGEGVREDAPSLLVPASSVRYRALTELTGQSAEIEERIRPITSELNAHSLRVNAKTWAKNLEKAQEAAELNTAYCRQLAGDDAFRPNSSAECRHFLQTKETDADALTALFHDGNLLAGAVVNCRSAISRLSQVRSWQTYALLGSVNAYWDSLGCPHGRYTSELPSLNNRIDLIRETIEPDPGHSFLSLDLNAAEYCVWASLSQDPTLCGAFRDGLDFHTTMAEAVKALVLSWCPEDLRAAGKTLNYSILYLMGSYALSRRLGCSQELANQIIDTYHSKAPVATAYITDQLARAEHLGFAETHFGRRRFCPEYQTTQTKHAAHESEKTLFNHVIAGTSAEIVKTKQICIWDGLRKAGFTQVHSRLSIQTYDGLVWTVRDDCLEEVRQLTEELWSLPEEGFLNFRSTVKVGKTWQEVQK